jgi:hypothetical protein
MPSNTRPSVRRSHEQWQRLIDEQHNGELTQREFCQQNSIAVSSFCNWKRRLSQEEAANPSAEDTNWLSLPEQLFSSPGNWRIELDLGGGLCLRLTQG